MPSNAQVLSLRELPASLVVDVGEAATSWFAISRRVRTEPSQTEEQQMICSTAGINLSRGPARGKHDLWRLFGQKMFLTVSKVSIDAICLYLVFLCYIRSRGLTRTLT